MMDGTNPAKLLHFFFSHLIPSPLLSLFVNSFSVNNGFLSSGSAVVSYLLLRMYSLSPPGQSFDSPLNITPLSLICRVIASMLSVFFCSAALLLMAIVMRRTMYTGAREKLIVSLIFAGKNHVHERTGPPFVVIPLTTTIFFIRLLYFFRPFNTEQFNSIQGPEHSEIWNHVHH